MKRLAIAVAFALLVAACGSVFCESRQAWLRGSETRWLSNYPVASTGPFKGVLVATWWMEIQRLQMSFQYEDIFELTEGICHLQPNIPGVWEYMGWNLAFNLLAETAHDRSRQIAWLERGIRLMQEGLHYNPDGSVLNFYLAFTIYNKFKGEFNLGPELERILGDAPMEVARRYAKAGLDSPEGEVDYWRHDFYAQLAAETGRADEALAHLEALRVRYPKKESRINELTNAIRSRKDNPHEQMDQGVE